jgi:hypothetical protein
MKIFTLLIGFLLGAFTAISAVLAAEVVHTYKKAVDLDPWNEYAAEEDPHREAFDAARWQTVDELNQERLAKQEFYTREEVEQDEEDNDL